MVPPYSDGSKCLVRELCSHLKGVVPHVLGTEVVARDLGPRAISHAVYGNAGRFSPALQQNIRAALWMLLRSKAELWHFVFAPNLRSSQVGRALRRLRSVPTVQTIASPPRDFSQANKLLFGDVVVAQSEWTRAQFAAVYNENKLEPPPIFVIPPPAPPLSPPSAEAVARVKERLHVGNEQEIFLYPGDLEVSQGAQRIVEWSKQIAQRVPAARVVVAYREKTSQAENRARELRSQVDPKIVHFEKNVDDIHALISAATAVVFPVDDLYGKVDQPIVLLEAFRLGTPVLALNQGPLASLRGAQLLSASASDWLNCIETVAQRGELFQTLRAAGRAAVLENYDPDRIAHRYEELYFSLLSGQNSAF